MKDKDKSVSSAEKQPKRGGLRLLTWLMIVVIAATSIIDAFCIYNIFGKGPKDTMAAEQLSEEQLLIQEESISEKKAKAEAEGKGVISYRASGINGKSDIVITDADSAAAALGALNGDFGFVDPENEFKLRFFNEGKIFDTYSLRQMINGYPVYGRDMKVVADKKGNLIAIAGNYFRFAEDYIPNPQKSESDIKGEVTKYLKSEYQVNIDKDYSISSNGSWVFIDNDDTPHISYAYIVYDRATDNAVQSVIADADTGEILYKSNSIGKQSSDFSTYYFRKYEPEELEEETEEATEAETEAQSEETAEGQSEGTTEAETEAQSEETAEGQSEETTEEETEEVTEKTTKEKLESDVFNEDKGIYVYADYDEKDGFKPAKESSKDAVQLMSEIGRAEDFFKKNFEKEPLEGYYVLLGKASERHREFLRTEPSENDLTVRYEQGDIENIPSIAASAFVGSIDANDAAREYVKAILPYDIADDSVYSQGLADIFAELIEDYNDGGFGSNSGSCNWETGDPNGTDFRSMKNPSSSGNAAVIDDTCGKTSGLTHEELLHDSTMISYSAYLMTQKNNDEEPLSPEQLSYLYYTAIPFITTEMSYEQFRDLIITVAVQLRDNKSVADKYVLNDSQIMNIINAFDAVGISRSGYARAFSAAYSNDAEFTVYNAECEKYGECHLTVIRSSDGEKVIDEDINDPVFTLGGIDPGIYTLILTDRNGSVTYEMNDFIVNKESPDNKAGEYTKSEKLRTKFGSLKRSVALVLDVSGSMRGTPMQETILAAVKFVDYVLEENPNIDISIVPYSDYADTKIVSSSDRNELVNAIQSLNSDGGTNMHDGIDKAYEVLEKTDSDRKLMFVMSDGYPETGPVGDDGTYESAIKERASEVKDAGVIVYSLGFFHKLDGTQLKAAQKLMNDIASPGYSYNVKTSEDMAYAFNDLADNIGGKYSVVVRIACPVDVTVRCSGEVLSSDPEELNTRASFGSLGFEGEDNEIKVLRLDNDTNYEICINGTGEGKMDYSISFADDEGEYSDVRTFSDVPISKDTIICTNTRSSGKTVLDVDSDGDGKFDESYTAKKNGKGKVRGKAAKTAAAIVIGILLTVFVIVECIFAYRRSKRNKVCSKCGGAVGKDTRFCRVCGEEVHRVPLWLPETQKREKQSSTVITAKLVAMGICMLITVSVVTIYRSAATTVYMQLRDQELVSAERLYDGSVSDSGIQKKYLSFLTERYIKKVNSRCSSGDYSESSANAVYESVFQMNMGGASDLADDYLKEHGIEAVRKPKKEKTEVTSEYEEVTKKSSKKGNSSPFGF